MESLSQTLKAGIEKGIIELTADRSRINYISLNKSKSFTDPEEKVQAETYISLIINYNYPIQRIDMFVKVQMGSETKEADIVVYADDAKLQPLIVVECKKNEISEAEFKKAVEQGFSYAYAMAGTIKYVYVTSGLKSEFYRVNKDKKTRETITTIPFFGKDIPLYKYAKGGRQKNEAAGDDPIKQQYFDLEIITEADLTHAFQLAHQALWAGGQLNPSEAFDELDKLIFCKIWDERKLRKSGEPYDFQIIDIISTEDIDKETKITNNLYKRIIALYEEGRKKDKEVFRDDIRLTPQRVRTIVGYLQDINLSKTDLDSKGRAFETFMGSYFRGDFGQYFTPRNVVKFIVDSLPINHESKVLDSSCGSGGFLLYALDKVRKQALEYYPDPNSADNFRHWHDFAEKKLFGMEINEQIARSAKMNMIIHDDGHTNVISIDGLLTGEKGTEDENLIVKTSGNQGFEYGTFDFIITNPPFGSIVKQTECAYLHQYNLGLKEKGWLDTSKKQDPTNRDSQSTEILFIEQDFKFLADGGFLAIVIPDGILTNSSLQYVRDEIMSMFRIVAVVSLPQTAFAANGAGVKSSVLFLRKLSAQQRIDYQNKLHNLQNAIRKEHDYLNKVTKLNDDKLFKLKKHVGFVNTTGYVDKKDIEKTDEFKAWKREITEFYNAKVSEIQDRMNDILAERKKEELINYKIFMAIADEIGYDATGKKTANNDLDIIAPKLETFINSIIDDKDSLFFLNDDVDNNKIYLIGRNEFDCRWDPLFYASDFAHYFNIDSSTNLKNVCLSFSSGFGAGKDEQADSNNGFIQVRPTNIDNNGLLMFDKNIYVPLQKGVDFVKVNTILFNNTNSQELVGKTAILLDTNLKLYTSNHITSIIVDETKIIPEYLWILLNVYQRNKVFYSLCTNWNNQSGIGLDLLKSIKIPLPPMPIQHQIVEFYNSALNSRKKKLAAAAAKLASIDSYLLSELGITLPEDSKGDIEDRMFFVDFKDVIGGRLDPKYHSNKSQSLKECIVKSKYKKCPLSLLIQNECSGDWGEDVENENIEITKYTKCLVIRATEFDNKYNLNLDNSRTKYRYILNAKLNKMNIRPNDILIEKSGGSEDYPVGRVSIITEEIFNNYVLAYSNFIHKITSKDVNPIYLYYYLRLTYNLGLTDFMQSQTNGIRNLIMQEYRNMIVVIPDDSKQNEIVSKITTLRAEAKSLELEAEEILKQAREEVEKMILGKG